MKVFGPFKKIHDQIKDTFEYKLANISIDITENILGIMKRKGINRNELAKKMDVNRASVSQFLNEGSNITIKRLLKISEALDCDINIQILERANAVKEKQVIESRYTPSYQESYSNLVVLDDYRKGSPNETACG